MVPLPGRATYLDRQIRPKPDLYGPFWITATLIFSTAISANIANYLMSEGHEHSWSYDFHKVSLAATAIYSYAFLLPIILWGLMWYRQSSNRYTLLEILCVYGYSLAIYVPISILWVIQVAWFQWILVIIGAALSGTVLLQTFWPIFKDENKKIAAVVLCLILLFHTLLAVGFVAYFFQVPSSSKTIVPSSTVAPDLHSSSLHQDVNDSHIQSLSLIKDQNEVKTKESNDSEKANKLLEKEHNVKKKMMSKTSVSEVTSVKLSVTP
ncbi:Protein YIPF1, partial [Stegodyphus mimosarum]